MTVDELVGVAPVAKPRPLPAGRAKLPGRTPSRLPAGRALVVLAGDRADGTGIAETLRARALEPITVRPEAGQDLPDPRAVQAAILVGSGRLSGNAGPAAPDAHAEWLREAHGAGTPVLALGAGAQLLARAFGGSVEPARESRHGWVRVTTSVPKLISPGPWLAWGDASIRLPARAKVLAHDRVGPQAFRIDRQLGIQFHPEATPELVARWIAASETTLDHQGIMEATWRELRSASYAADRLLGSFIRYATRRRG